MSRFIFLLLLSLMLFVDGFLLPENFDEPINRIVGGQDAPDGGVPYQVSLRSSLNSHFCGGAILSNRWIMTAAHCTVSRIIKYTMLAVVGTNRLSSGGVTYLVSDIIVHEDYDSTELVNDISVVKVMKNIAFNVEIQPIRLPDKNTRQGASLILTGWGKTSYPGDLTDRLQIINLKALSVSECQKVHNGSITPRVYRTQICSLTKEGQGACHGDSGGPLVEGDRLVGIVSWGMPCAIGYPDVYTRVYAFKGWIEKKTNIAK